MKHSESTPRTQRTPHRALWLGCGLLALGGLHACSGSGGAVGQGPSNPAGSVQQKPDGSWFYVDQNDRGLGQEPRIARQMHGRLVEVFGLDVFGARVPMFSDFVIASDLVSDGQSYLVETNPVTSQHLLVILRDVTDSAQNGGRAQFFKLLFQAEQNLAPIHNNDANGAGIYSMVPRNSAIVVQFDDLIDAKTLESTTLRFNVGNPPVLPFEARIFVDPNHGDLADYDQQSGLEFYGTRVIVDTTVSELESFSLDPPLPVNGVGMPPSSDVNLANLEIRIPTKINANAGQLYLLRNPSGHPITSKNNGPTDNSHGTSDVVRAARSGGPENVTGDKYNGFMPDKRPPLLVGNTPVTIVSPPEPTGEPDVFKLPTVQFQSVFCSQTPGVGDVLRQPGIFAEVLQQPAPVDGNGEIRDLFVRLLLHPFDHADEWAGGGTGTAQFLAAYDPVDDAGREACFVRVFPDAVGFPENPVSGLQTDSTYSLRFSEPMDPASLTAFDSVTITRQPVPSGGGLPTSDYVVGSLSQSVDLQEFTFLTNLPLAHLEGTAEPYWLTLSTQSVSPTDLAGNFLVDEFPQVEMTVDPTELTQYNGGRVTRFTSIDEEPPFGDEITGPLPEWGGQHLYEPARELIKPRPVVHFNSTADRSKPVPKLMTPFPQGVQTPLSGMGSRMQTLWRYCDFGWSLTDATNHNIDVEGLYWSPAIGAVVAETFGEFSIRVGHCKYLPDEYIDPGSLFPRWQDSGITKKFDGNWLKQSDNKVVHSRDKGYTINPGDLFVHPVSGTKLVPFPWNQGADPDNWKTWTWRDGSQRKRAGKDGSGAPLNQEFIATGQPLPTNIAKAIYNAVNIRAEGLPLLMEFKCYPDEGAVGLNAFDISLAANSSSKPYFRAFSTGGINKDGNTVLIDPDTEIESNGGFNPGSNPPGAPTYGRDNTYYIGAADFVTRISRVHSVWFRATDPFEAESLFPDPVYIEPITEPRAEDLPDGTSVDLAFRGANNILTNVRFLCQTPLVNNTEPLDNAQLLDSFGDYYDHHDVAADELPIHNPPYENKACDDSLSRKAFINFLNDDDEWHDDMAGIATAPFYQVRITFESDIFTGLVPEVSALAVSWHD